MKAIFELFLSASFFGSVMILLVVAARFVLRKACSPRSTNTRFSPCKGITSATVPRQTISA